MMAAVDRGEIATVVVHSFSRCAYRRKVARDSDGKVATGSETMVATDSAGKVATWPVPPEWWPNYAGIGLT